jgi:hypothetical protein
MVSPPLDLSATFNLPTFNLRSSLMEGGGIGREEAVP